MLLLQIKYLHLGGGGVAFCVLLKTEETIGLLSAGSSKAHICDVITIHGKGCFL